MVLKPFEIFFKKKFDSDEAKSEEARLAWASMSAKKHVKFIRKTENAYDTNDEENKEPLHSYLSKKELDILLKAYGMPEKPPQNSRYYYIDKYRDEYVNGSDQGRSVQDVKNDAAEKWKNLSKEEKEKITAEYHQVQEKYTDQFFNFARNLPEQRVVDFKYYTSAVKKSDTVDDESNENSSSVGSSKPKSHPKKSRENPFKAFIPHEVYIEKHHSDEVSFEVRAKLRSSYAALSDKKKLKYIKKAEEQYDSYDFSKTQTKPPLFTSFLSKNEVQILFDSYGMPENVPSNLSAYFMKKNFKAGLKDMRLVFNKFRGLNETEKANLLDEHARELKDFTAKNRVFVEKLLPATRLDDYTFLKNKNQTKSKALNDSNSFSQPAKKIKTN